MYPELYPQIGSLKDNGSLHRFAFLSNDGKLVACRQADNSMQIYCAVSGERLFVIRDTIWNRKIISPDGSKVLCSPSGYEIDCCDMATGSILWSLGSDELYAAIHSAANPFKRIKARESNAGPGQSGSGVVFMLSAAA